MDKHGDETDVTRIHEQFQSSRRREQKSNSNTPCSVDLLLSHTAFIETKLVRTYTMMYALAKRSMRGKRSEKLGRTGRNTAEFVGRIVRTDSAVFR